MITVSMHSLSHSVADSGGSDLGAVKRVKTKLHVSCNMPAGHCSNALAADNQHVLPTYLWQLQHHLGASCKCNTDCCMAVCYVLTHVVTQCCELLVLQLTVNDMLLRLRLQPCSCLSEIRQAVRSC